MKRFFQRRNEDANKNNNGIVNASFAAAASLSTTTSQTADMPLPSRKQRMQLLKSIIHNADKVQKQFLVPKQAQNDNKQSKTNNLFGNDDSAEVNNKCYQRWHEILQDGLVPLSVRALNLLERTEPSVAVQNGEDEEEAYFATLDGMDEEIQVMAILARAAALNDIDDDISDGDIDGSNVNDVVQGGHSEMEEINGSMKCIAMLLFHVVLESSSMGFSESESDDSPSSIAMNKTVPGYDGRVRHVMKMACVDILSRAILSTVEAYDQKNVEEESGENKEQSQQQAKNFDFGDAWNVQKIKSFLELEDLGREAIFGTPWKPSSESKGNKTDSDAVDESHLQEGESESDTEDENLDLESEDEIQEQAPTPEQIPQACDEGFDNAIGRPESGCLETEIDDSLDNGHEKYNISECEQEYQSKLEPGDVDADLPSKRRQFNAKFLATRKYELIERLVAIDIVRFLMAEEREKKLRDQKVEEQQKKIPKLPVFLRNSIAEEEADLHAQNGNTQEDEADQSNDEQDLDENASSRYFNASRIQRIKRGAKIATAGLAIGTVFAITGGLAAPALAAGIGGIAALTGATTASSTALLAVLATFKAGALLFGAGGGGIAAYKMKKRTAGLSQFEVRRENIEQYMYQGATEKKMKRGIAAMLPQLHTTVAVTGWLRENDMADFQLAWGCQPTCRYEQADDFKVRIRQLRRFYSIYNPPLVHLCEDFMLTLQSRLKKEFSWDRIWVQLENKYGSNPDHMIPLDTPRENEVFLSSDEKAMIDGVLNTAKVSNLAKKGLGAGEAFEFDENDEIADLLTQTATVSETSVKTAVDGKVDIESNTMENELDISATCIDEYQQNQQLGRSELSINASEGRAQSLQERMSSQRDKQVSFLKEKGLIQNDADLKEGAGSPKMASSVKDDDRKDEDTKADDTEDEDFNDGRCPVVWDWNRLYATDIHTVTWESKMLSSLCHIVENMAIEVSTQATKVALQFSVIGAIVSAVAIPSALLTATKLIDDPYQIVILRADEAGRELAKCLLQSDERRPVSLVGFSFGARVIYSCLRELAAQQDIWEESRYPRVDDNAERRKSKFGKKKASTSFEYDREPASLIADVIFIGLPRVIDKKVLTSCRRVTGGRLVNCYTKNDWLLSLMFMARAGIPAGVREVKDVPGIENFDVTQFVETHTKYADAIPSILQKVRFSEP